jgi:hypothetical protein
VPKSQLVAQHVPYLRRYARALTGNQDSGDSYVAAALEALVKEPKLLDIAALPRVALFRLFSTIWNVTAKDRTAGIGLSAGGQARTRYQSQNRTTAAPK